MFIQTEVTPNPATLKFLPGRAVMPKACADFTDEADAERLSPLASRIFAVDGVTGVFFGPRLHQRDQGRRRRLAAHEAGLLGAIMEHFMSGEPVRRPEAVLDQAGVGEPDDDHRAPDQGADGHARAPGGGPRRRRHHVSRLRATASSTCTCAAPARAARARSGR